MKPYTKPSSLLILEIENHPALGQYFLDDHSLTAVSQGPDGGCGFATSENSLFICLSGNEDVSSELTGLTATSSEGVVNTLLSCSISDDFVCSSGIGYACQVGTPGFDNEQCIISISDNHGNTISCSVSCQE